MDNISIFHDIVLALLFELTLGLHFGLITVFLDVIKLHDLNLNEAFLEVTVNGTGGLWSLGALANSPALDLILTTGVKVLEVKSPVTGPNEPVESTLGALLLAEGLTFSIRFHLNERLLEHGTEWDHWLWSWLRLDVLSKCDKVLVLLADEILLGKVAKVDDRLGGEELHSINDLDVKLVPLSEANINAILSTFKDTNHGVSSHSLLLVLGIALAFLPVLFLLHYDEGKVFGHELRPDSLEIADWVDITVDVDDVLVVKATDEVEDTVTCIDVTEEGVTETFTFGGTLDETAKG